jgi:heme-degrading monooxygenase HmoA
MEGAFYTHAMWRVRPGEEEAFVRAWSELADAFAALPGRPLWGTLIRSAADPALFYSFGPWRSAEDVAAMRADPAAQQALERVRSHCVEATPGPYELVRHVDLAPEPPAST